MGWNVTTHMLERVAAGNVHGATAVYLQGVNGSPTTSYETVWDESTAYTFLTANMSSPTISSSSASDTSAGTGARTVTISGVDSSYAVQTETLTLNGQTGVALVNSYMSINSMVVATAGSGGKAAGTIYVGTGSLTAGKPATVHGEIAAGLNQSTSFIYTVPANMALLVLDLLLCEEAASTGGSRAQFQYATNAGLNKIYGPYSLVTNGWIDHQFTVPLKFPAKTQLQLQFLSAAATNQVSASSSAILLDSTPTTAAQASNFATWIKGA